LLSPGECAETSIAECNALTANTRGGIVEQHQKKKPICPLNPTDENNF
jgi:hypothetical protein